MTGPTGQQPGDEDQDAGAQADAAEIAGRERLGEQVVRTGAFGTETTGDTSGYGGLQVRRQPVLATERPYGSYFDEVADALGGALEASGLTVGDAIERAGAEGFFIKGVDTQRLIDRLLIAHRALAAERNQMT